MNYRLLLLPIASAAAACLLFLGRSPAQKPEGDINSYIAKAPIEGLPPGSYGQWTGEQRQKAFTRIGGFCQYLCVDAYGATSFANEAAAELAKNEAKICLGACIANHLPGDYPQLAELKQQLRADYERAKQLGSKAPWPLPGK